MTIARILLTLIIALVISGCKIVPISQDKPTSIKYWGVWDSATVMNQIREDYKKINPEIDIVYEKKSLTQYREALKSQINSGRGPDIFQFHNTWALMFQTELAPIPSGVISQNEFKEDYYPVVFSTLRNDSGNLLGAPIGIDGLALYYNEEIFQAAGVAQPPTTWQELSQVATKLTVRDTAGNIRTAGIALGTSTNVDHFSDILALMILQNGGDLRSPTDKRSADALQYYVNFARGEDRVWDESMPSSTIAFGSNILAMYLAPSWRAAELKVDYPQLKFKVAPVPQLEGGSATWASFWAIGVSSQSKVKDEALKFLKYLQENETLVKLHNEAVRISDRYDGMPYPKKSLAPYIASDPIFGAFITDAPFMRSFPVASNTLDNGINDEMIKIYQEAVTATLSGGDAAASLTKAAGSITKVLAKYPLAE